MLVKHVQLCENIIISHDLECETGQIPTDGSHFPVGSEAFRVSDERNVNLRMDLGERD